MYVDCTDIYSKEFKVLSDITRFEWEHHVWCRAITIEQELHELIMPVTVQWFAYVRGTYITCGFTSNIRQHLCNDADPHLLTKADV